jgi:hypothetical protein
MPRRPDHQTKDLFSWEPEAVSVGYGEDVAGRGSLDHQIARLVSRALRDAKDAGTYRSEIAARISEYLGRRVSEGIVNKWASEGAEGHRISLEGFVALIHATGQHDLLGFIPSIFGFAVVSSRHVDLIELQQLQEHEAEVAARKAVLLAKTRGLR